MNNDELIQFDNKLNIFNPKVNDLIKNISNDILNNEISKADKKNFDKVSDLMSELTIPIGLYVKQCNNIECSNNTNEYKDTNVIDDNLFDKLYSLAEYKNNNKNKENTIVQIFVNKPITKKNKKSSKKKRTAKKSKKIKK